MTGRLMTAEQVAERWQVPTGHVYRLAREGRIPVVRLGRYRRFNPDAVEAFENNHEKGDSMILHRQPHREITVMPPIAPTGTNDVLSEKVFAGMPELGYGASDQSSAPAPQERPGAWPRRLSPDARTA